MRKCRLKVSETTYHHEEIAGANSGSKREANLIDPFAHEYSPSFVIFEGRCGDKCNAHVVFRIFIE
ncbi:hypothetical protein CYR75_04400 [Paracoccus jeotgali]|uniref:Uncharacterized protein n=1 Tax=Paracoccus jeotgali TaxID=2065379 RepID=A0A2K9MDA8_9RHOB|nr:hypothetical protein CYR75_04400 [Paracoccus jeotgali]